MKPSTSRSAPLAPSDTPVLCLREVSTASIVVPSRFIVAPAGRRHGRHRRLFEASPRTAAFLPLTSLDQSPELVSAATVGGRLRSTRLFRASRSRATTRKSPLHYSRTAGGREPDPRLRYRARIYPLPAYTAAFGVCGFFILAGALMALMVRETRCQNIYETLYPAA